MTFSHRYSVWIEEEDLRHSCKMAVIPRIEPHIRQGSSKEDELGPWLVHQPARSACKHEMVQVQAEKIADKEWRDS